MTEDTDLNIKAQFKNVVIGIVGIFPLIYMEMLQELQHL